MLDHLEQAMWAKKAIVYIRSSWTSSVDDSSVDDSSVDDSSVDDSSVDEEDYIMFN